MTRCLQAGRHLANLKAMPLTIWLLVVEALVAKVVEVLVVS
jgi:hypothetical protein